MMAHGLLRRDDDGRLQLGHRFAVPDLEHVAGSVLTQLQQRTGATAQIWVRRGEHGDTPAPCTAASVGA